jgi:hypothetical protein
MREHPPLIPKVPAKRAFWPVPTKIGSESEDGGSSAVADLDVERR